MIASERLDDTLDWRPLKSGELIHGALDLTVSSTVLVDGPPRSRLSRLHMLESWFKAH